MHRELQCVWECSEESKAAENGGWGERGRALPPFSSSGTMDVFRNSHDFSVLWEGLDASSGLGDAWDALVFLSCGLESNQAPRSPYLAPPTPRPSPFFLFHPKCKSEASRGFSLSTITTHPSIRSPIYPFSHHQSRDDLSCSLCPAAVHRACPAPLSGLLGEESSGNASLQSGASGRSLESSFGTQSEP